MRTESQEMDPSMSCSTSVCRQSRSAAFRETFTPETIKLQDETAEKSGENQVETTVQWYSDSFRDSPT